MEKYKIVGSSVNKSQPVRLSVAHLKRALRDFDSSANVYLQLVSGSSVAIVALPRDEDEVDKRRGRFADEGDIVAILEKIS